MSYSQHLKFWAIFPVFTAFLYWNQSAIIQFRYFHEGTALWKTSKLLPNLCNFIKIVIFIFCWAPTCQEWHNVVCEWPLSCCNIHTKVTISNIWLCQLCCILIKYPYWSYSHAIFKCSCDVSNCSVCQWLKWIPIVLLETVPNGIYITAGPDISGVVAVLLIRRI